MIIVRKNADQSSNFWWDCLHFTECWYPRESYESNDCPFGYGLIVGQAWFFNFGKGNSLERKPVKHCLKIDLESHPAHMEGLSKYIYMQIYEIVFIIITAKSVLGMTLNCIRWWSSSSSDIENVEYPFIAITLRSTLTRINSTC